MKLLMTTDTLGGVWTYCMELCAALQREGIEIDLATMGRPLSRDQRNQVARLPHVWVHESNYRLCWMPESAHDVQRAGEWLLLLERELKPDLVQLNDLGHGGLAWRSPVMLVGHSCVFSWWRAVKRSLPPPEWDTYRRLVSAGVQRADLLLAPSRPMLNLLLHYYGPARASGVIANARGYPQAPRQRKATECIFTAGRVWDEAKNIRALAAIAKQLPWPVYVAGEAADPDGDGDAPTELHCLGFLQDREMAKWLHRAAIYAAPAFYEPFGLGILEAARAGCALVLGDIETLRDIWDDAAIFVRPDDREQLHDALLALIQSPILQRLYARRARQHAQSYGTEQMAKQYLRCYRGLMEHSVQAPAPVAQSDRAQVLAYAQAGVVAHRGAPPQGSGRWAGANA